VTTDGELILVGTPNLGGPSQLDAALFARDGGGDFVPADGIPSPSPGFPGFEGYGQSVTLLGDQELAISQLFDAADTGNASVFLFEIVP
jgi:hypothetical protein